MAEAAAASRRPSVSGRRRELRGRYRGRSRSAQERWCGELRQSVDVLAAWQRWPIGLDAGGWIAADAWMRARCLRLREVEVHHVDLGVGYVPTDWPVASSAAARRRAATLPRCAGVRRSILRWLPHRGHRHGRRDGDLARRPGRGPDDDTSAAMPTRSSAGGVATCSWLLGRNAGTDGSPCRQRRLGAAAAVAGSRTRRLAMTKRIEYRTCPLCEATCGLELHLDGDEITLVRGDRDDVSATGSSARRAPRSSSSRPTPTGSGTPQIRRGDTLARRDVGRGVRRDRARSAPILERARPRRGRRLPRQPERAQPRRARLQPRAAAERSAPRTSTRRARSTRCRSRCRPGLMFGAALTSRSPTSTAPTTSDARRQPVRVERQPDDRARLPRPAARRSGRAAARSSSSTRAGRRPRRRPTSTSSSGPAPTRTSSSRSCTCCSPRTSSTSAPSPSHVDGLDEVAAARRATFTPEAVAPRVRHRRRRRSGASPASSRPRRARRGVRPHRHVHAGVRHARVLARRRASTCSPATSTATGGAMFTAAGDRRRQRRRARRARAAACASAGAAAGCAGCPSSSASCPVVCARRGDRDAGRRARSAR